MRIFRILIILIGVIFLTACSADSPSGDVAILVDEHRFSPRRVEVLAGKPVTLHFYNIGDQEHQLAIREIPMIVEGKTDPLAAHAMKGSSQEMTGAPPQLHVVAPVGKHAQLSFTPAEPGEYTYECILPGHTEKGVLVVQ